MEEKRRARILIAGEPTHFASNISMSTFDFFSESKVDFEIEHAFSPAEVFQLMQEKWDLVLIDQNLQMATFLRETFISLSAYQAFWLFFFDSLEEQGLNQKIRRIFSLIKEGVNYG